MASTKQNTPGLGIEYEVHLPAYFALLLNTNPEIEDFKLRSNVQDFGNLDDLLVDIKTKSGENLYFAFQLKHKENFNKNLLPTNFEAKGDFNLEKYCEAFKNLNDENRKKYHFILYTNKNFDSSRSNEVHKFDMKQDECCLGRNFFDTSGNGKHLYKFEVNEETEDGKCVNKDDFREFFSQFSLYTGQTNIRDLDKSHILDILKHRECYVTYIDFFRRWHRGDFIDKIIDKKTLNIHLVDIILSSVTIKNHLSDGQDGNSIFFETMVQHFDVTIINAPKQDFIKRLETNIQKYPEEFNKNSEEEIIKLGKKSKLIDRFTKKLTEETKLKLLHYFYQKPLILDFHESSKDVIYEAIKLCKIQENGIKLVIVGRDIDESKFLHLKIFTNLSGVDGKFLEEIKRRCKLSLQGRNISFEEIFEDKIREFVTPREIFQMLKGSFSIGEDKEKLPECYIPRTVSATVFDNGSIIKHSSRSTAIIFYYEDKFDELKILIQKIVDREDYFYEDFLDGIILRNKEPSKTQLQEDNSKNTFPELPAIILRREECSGKKFNEIREKIGKAYIHLFKVIDRKRCLLLRSTNNISYNKHYKYTKISVDEKNIHIFFNNSINILCAQPGMGKSTLMKYLRNECDPNFWTLRVDLKAHNLFLKRNHKIEYVLNYFLELENCQDIFLLNIKKMFLEKRKIVLFLDGLDEVGKECVDTVLNITRQLSEMGFRIWLSSRQNLQQKLEQYFNNFAIGINELNENQQKEYIENRLLSLYNKNEIEEIVKTIFSNTNLANNRQILEIPLQLHIITQIFLDDKSYYYSDLRENNFILTKMLEIFFEGKYTHYLAKIELKHNHFLSTLLEEKLENYEIVALHSVLDDEHFQKLQIEKLTVTQIRNSDLLGIITEINSENKAVFEHLTYAEYFASKFLVKNFDKARILKEEIFTQKYQNLLLIFNIMLAEDSPLHLAIIHKDLSQIQDMEESSLMDKGGRNFLQVAACVATRHPSLESYREPFSSECLVKDFPVQHFKGEDSKIKEIVNRILLRESFKNDEIFEWNSLDYALATGALYVVEAILEKSEKPSNFYEILGKYYSDEVVAYYSIRFGYHRLLSKILEKKSFHVPGILSDYLWWQGNNSILHFLFTLDCTNRTRIVGLLTSDDINKAVYDKTGYSFLHFAVLHEDIEFLNFLLQKGADVNVQDKDGWPPLFLVIKQGNFDISKLLIEKGANVNIKDKDGWSSLFWAVERNNFEISKLLIEGGADVNIKDEEGWSPVLWAANRSNFEILKHLVEKGADFNIKDKDGKSALIWAIMRRNLQISKLLIEKGADINVKDEDGFSPLLWSVKQNNLGILKLLVEKGADVNIQSKDGWSPLLWATDRNYMEILKLLVEKGADVNIKNEDGLSPLLWTVKKNNLEICKFLIEKGADVNIQCKSGTSPLSWAADLNYMEISKLLVEKGADVNIKDKDGLSPLVWTVKQNNLEICKFLIEKGADVNIKDKNDWSPLIYSVYQSNLEASKLLIEKGADVNIKDNDGLSPLLWTVKQNNLEICKFLIEKGADVNIKDKDDCSPLIYSANQSNLEASKLLIEKGADVNVKNKAGWSPLFYAVNQNNFENTKLLIEKGADVNIKNNSSCSPLFYAVNQSNFEIAKLLIEKGADVNIKDEDGLSPLFWTVKQNNLEICKFLIEKGADVNMKVKDDWSPLIYAVNKNNFEIVKSLIEKGADVNIQSKNGTSLLSCAADRNYIEICKFLIEKGADVNIKDKEGQFSLLWAVKRNSLQISKLLIDKGADVNMKDKDGKSPLFWAVERNNVEIAKMLLEGGAEVNCETKRNVEITSIQLLFSEEAETKKNSPLLRLAVKRENFNLVQILIDKGASWNVETFLDAICGGNIQIIDLFLGKGVDLSKLNDFQKAIILIRNNAHVVNYLIENGVDVTL